MSSVTVLWDNSNVCMQVECRNGHSYHADTDEEKFVECPECGDIIDLPQELQIKEPD